MSLEITYSISLYMIRIMSILKQKLFISFGNFHNTQTIREREREREWEKERDKWIYYIEKCVNYGIEKRTENFEICIFKNENKNDVANLKSKFEMILFKGWHQSII